MLHLASAYISAGQVFVKTGKTGKKCEEKVVTETAVTGTGLLQGKVIVVTGAAGGIGKATAINALNEGAVVIATGANPGEVDALSAETDAPGWQVRLLDVRAAAQVKAVATEIFATFGAIDGLVNSAGILIPGNLSDSTESEYDRIFDVNVRGTYLTCQAFLPAMLGSGSGSIVNIGSINSLAAEPQLALYTASKGAVLMLTRAIAIDYAAQGIRANTVCPGFVDTPFNRPHYELLGGRALLEAALPDFHPIGRAIEALEVAQAIAFLLSDSSRAITGTALVIDGGALAKA